MGIVLNDPRENVLPKAGLIKFRDAETGEVRHIDTSDRSVQKWFAVQNLKRMDERKISFY